MTNIEHSEIALQQSFKDILNINVDIEEMYRVVWQVSKFISEVETEQLQGESI